MSVLAHEGTYPILYGAYAVPVGSGHVSGYLARPDQAGRFATVLVLPDAGLTSHHKDLSRRLARHGLATLVIELPATLTGAVMAVADAGAFAMANDWAIDHHVGVVGIGSGGLPGVVFAADQPDVRAVVLVSTSLVDDPPPASSLPRLAVPVLGLYGATEPAESRPDHDLIRDAEFVVYEGVGAGFMDDGAEGYDVAAATDAYRRVMAFFGRNLPPPTIERLG